MKMRMILPMMLIAALPLGADAQNKSGLVMSNLDKTVKPADSFYQFATGGWQKNNPLPAAYSRYGSFERLAENNNKRINTILSELQKKTYKAGTIEQKLSDFYKLSM
ncbi:MAG TPA: M13 family metallopeptidase N-terminal domain-containing protein, partial [Prevotella sp.]|nr:M13 family metallopeptidase N-terminal domain-containing protein [Prevotella sp.]